MDVASQFMKIALEEAFIAYRLDEIPIGAIIVKNGEVIARAHNSNRAENDATRHAEIVAISMAGRILDNERLLGCDLYVTKEPCVMCAGAIVHSRINTVYIGARDMKYGACGSVLSLCSGKVLNHAPIVKFGICENESVAMLKSFFKEKRRVKK